MKKAIPIVMLVALTLAPSMADAHLYRALAEHRFVLGFHGMFGVPMTTYKQNSNFSNNIYPHFGINLGYLISPMYGIHLRFDANFAFFLNFDDCTQQKCQERAFDPSVKLYDFGLAVDSNISLSSRYPWFLTPEIGLGVTVVAWDGWSRSTDPQVAMALRLALGLTYTFRRRVDIRIMVARFNILLPVHKTLSNWWGNQAMWEPTLGIRFRF